MEGLEEYRTVSLPALPNPFEEFFKTGGNNVRARFLKSELGEKYRYYEYFKKMTGLNGIYARMPYDIFVN
jgi:protease-4